MLFNLKAIFLSNLSYSKLGKNVKTFDIVLLFCRYNLDDHWHVPNKFAKTFRKSKTVRVRKISVKPFFALLGC